MKLIICFTVDEYREIENLTKKREESYKNKKGKWNRVYPAKSKTERATGFQAENAYKFDPNNIGKPCYVLKKKYLFPIWKLRDMC